MLFSLFFSVCCAGSSICVELITSSVESYRLCLIVYDLESLTMKRPGPELGCCATDKIKIAFDEE
jgi:hypothetical protein